MTKQEQTPVLVTTEHRGVFAGLADTGHDRHSATITLNECRMAIAFGTTKGVLQLADSGPTKNSRIGAPAQNVALRGVTMVTDINPDAWEAWETA